MNIEKYPKSMALLREKSVKALTAFVNAFPVGEGFEKDFITEDLINGSTAAMLENNPRALFDIFDSEDIIIGIYPSWKFGINDVEYDAETKTRPEIEALAFEEAFKILEAKL